MKKTITILALALCIAVPTVNASNSENVTTPLVLVEYDAKISPLCMAAAQGDVVKVKQLLKNGIDINKKSNGMQPIHYAARYNRVEVIKVLITAGSEIHTTCDKGFTAERHAELSKATEAAELLHRFRKRNI